MTIGCTLQYLNDLFEIKLIFYRLSRTLQFSEFVWALRSSVWDAFNNFLFTDAMDKSKTVAIKSVFLSHLAPFPFFANTPFNDNYSCSLWTTTEYGRGINYSVCIRCLIQIFSTQKFSEEFHYFLFMTKDVEKG